MGYLRLFNSVFKFTLILQRRYLFDLATGIIYMLLFLVFIQLGLNSFDGHVSNAFMSEKLSVLIIGFFSFMLISNSTSVVAHSIVDGSVTGTLEQAALSPYGIEGVFLSMAISRSLINLILTLAVIPISMLICRHWFEVDLLHLFILVVPTWLCCWGIGFMLGSLALVFKRVQSFLSLTQFLALTLIILKSYPFGVLSLLPISPQAVTMYRMIGLQQHFSAQWLIYLYIHGMIYLVLGVAVFKIGECYAKQKGILGQY